MNTKTKQGSIATCFYMSSETILLKTSFASVIISTVRYIEENQNLQVMILFLFYRSIVVNTYRFAHHFCFAAIDCKNEICKSAFS